MSADSTYAVKPKGLTFKREPRVIFNSIDVCIPCGKVAGIMGPSGYGKTMLLRLIASQLRPSKGEIWVNERNLPQLLRGDLFDVRKQFGVLSQSGALFIDFNVFENAAFPLRVHTQLPEEMTRDIVLTKSRAVGLRGTVELMPDELSGGVRCRAALARVIALDPQIPLYDEPFVGQDPIATGALVRLIRLLNDVIGITGIVVSRDLAKTTNIADYIYIVSDGRVPGHGAPDVLEETNDPCIRQFVKGIPDNSVPSHYPARDYWASLLRER